MAWTEEMVEELKKLWAEGVTTSAIGKRLGISKNSIVGKVHRLGLEGRPSPIKKSDETSNKKESSSTKTTKKTTEKAPKLAKSDSKRTSKSENKKATLENSAKQEAPSVEVLTQTEQSDKPTPKKIKPQISPKPEPVIEPSIEEEDIKLIKSLEVKQETIYHGNVSLTELDNHTCRWPIGDPKDPDFHFCGHKVKTGQTYCEEHSAIAYVKPTRK